MTARNPWRPTRRRLTDTLNSALAPIAACSLALGGLTTWVTAGRAGDPPRITVSPGRVLLPYGDSTRTAAFFDIANTGDADDRLLRVTSAETGGDLELSRHVMTGKAAASRETMTSVAVRAAAGSPCRRRTWLSPCGPGRDGGKANSSPSHSTSSTPARSRPSPWWSAREAAPARSQGRGSQRREVGEAVRMVGGQARAREPPAAVHQGTAQGLRQPVEDGRYEGQVTAL